MDPRMPLFRCSGLVVRTGVLTVLSVLQWQVLGSRGQRGSGAPVFYALELEGGARAAGAIARHHGLQFISRIGNLEDHYTFRGSSSSSTLEHTLALHAAVKWVQKQQTHYRDKRATIPAHQSSKQYKFGEFPGLKQSRRGFGETHHDLMHFNDPLWPMQWNLLNYGQVGSSRLDLNVIPVWRRNITGSGVVVCIIDDGVDHSNLDLKKNFEAFASYDLRGAHGLSHDPMPQRDEENGHGTKCAGEVAMEANNSYCGVGIAFNARIGGVRLLDGSVTDSMEASALTYNNDFIDIYVCCWGPRDDGAEMGGPGSITEKALHLGTLKGRGGKGSIFVWASGNGGMFYDHCGADGYINSIYTVAISAVSHLGNPTHFGEPCPAVMAVTLTGGSSFSSPPLVTVSNLGDGCITNFAGTSSAAPIAAGVLALVLEANAGFALIHSPDLTWRDVQHLIARTAKIPNPNQPGWMVNGAGYHVHDRYGFGLLDAALMVQQAQRFAPAAEQHKCEQSVTPQPVRILPSGGEVSVDILSEACRGQHNEVNALEHVQVRVNVSSVCRGDMSVELLSPMGTRTLLLATRRNDASESGLRNWTLMSVQSWGENPQGTWTLIVKDHKGTVVKCGRRPVEEAAGAVLNITLILYGTYNPNSTQHGLLSGIVSMGEFYALPGERVYMKRHFAPQDLIQRAYQLEHDRKVGPDDIAVAPHRHKKPKVAHLSNATFRIEDMDDTNGENIRSHLLTLWNTLRGRVQGSSAIPNLQQSVRGEGILHHTSPHFRETRNLRAFIHKKRGRKQKQRVRKVTG